MESPLAAHAPVAPPPLSAHIHNTCCLQKLQHSEKDCRSDEVVASTIFDSDPADWNLLTYLLVILTHFVSVLAVDVYHY